MKRFALSLTVVMMSVLPALLLFAPASGGSVYDKDGKVDSPTGKNYKLARKATTSRASQTPKPPRPAANGAVNDKGVDCAGCPKSVVGLNPPTKIRKHTKTGK